MFLNKPTRTIDPIIIPDRSITRFHLLLENSMLPHMGRFELHMSHYPDGNITEPAQWYDFYISPQEWDQERIRELLNIPFQDWRVIDQLLGSFYWAAYWHTTPGGNAEIRLDYGAMKSGEWSTMYF